MQDAESLQENLIRKGWSEEEAQHTRKILFGDESEQRKTAAAQSMSSVQYWVTLAVLIVCSLLLSIVLIPLLIVMSPGFVEGILAVIGILFGWLFFHLIENIEHLRTRHHLFATFFVPAVAIVNLFVSLQVAGIVADRFSLTVNQNPLFLALIFVLAFLVPFSIARFRERLTEQGILKKS